MKEVNLNSVNSTLAAQRTSRAPASVAADKVEIASAIPIDTVETHTAPVPDFKQAEQEMEARYALHRSRLEKDVNGPSYPSIEMIDRLARLLASQSMPFKDKS